MHNSVSITVSFRENTTASQDEMLNSISDLLMCIADKVSINEVVPGHIKAVITGKEGYISYNCTRPGVVNRRVSNGTKVIVPTNPLVHLEIILIGFSKEQIKTHLDDCLKDNKHILGSR